MFIFLLFFIHFVTLGWLSVCDCTISINAWYTSGPADGSSPLPTGTTFIWDPPSSWLKLVQTAELGGMRCCNTSDSREDRYYSFLRILSPKKSHSDTRCTSDGCQGQLGCDHSFAGRSPRNSTCSFISMIRVEGSGSSSPVH